jgi:Flp pilus assembly protein TadG
MATTLPAVECPKSRHYREGKRRGEGQVTVEFALVCLPFFVILFAIIDYAQISLQNAMRETARFATAGRIIQAVNSDGTLAYETNKGVIIPRAIQSQYWQGGTNANGTHAYPEASRNECARYWFLSNCLFSLPLASITISNAATLPGVPPFTTTNANNGEVTLVAPVYTTTNGTTTTTTTNAAPGPGAINNYVQITASMTIQTITPMMSYLGGYNGNYFSYRVYVSAIVKNEPALLNFQHIAIYTNEP